MERNHPTPTKLVKITLFSFDIGIRLIKIHQKNSSKYKIKQLIKLNHINFIANQ